MAIPDGIVGRNNQRALRRMLTDVVTPTKVGVQFFRKFLAGYRFGFQS